MLELDLTLLFVGAQHGRANLQRRECPATVVGERLTGREPFVHLAHVGETDRFGRNADLAPSLIAVDEHAVG